MQQTTSIPKAKGVIDTSVWQGRSVVHGMHHRQLQQNPFPQQTTAGACLVPAVTLWVRLADLAVQAVGVGRHHNLGHQRRKSLAIVGLGRRQRHCAKCAPMEGVLRNQVKLGSNRRVRESPSPVLTSTPRSICESGRSTSLSTSPVCNLALRDGKAAGVINRI